MSATKSWDDLVAAALLGTERNRGAVSGLPPALAGPVASVDRTDPAAAVLDTAALLATYRRAGTAIRRQVEPLAEARAETRAPAGAAAARRLAALLDGRDDDLVREWVAVAARLGLRAPAGLVPALLDLGTRNSALRPDLTAVAGQRGRWLAGLNPAWKYVLATATDDALDEQAWELGSLGDRVTYFTGLRAQDPSRARELLASAWAAEDADVRAALLPVLAAGLGPDDEAFLVAAQNDRRHTVRSAAADLLVQLPGSALAERMAARALACVRVDRKLLRERMTITPPTWCDPETRRDGVRPSPPQGTGDRAWWLSEIVARTRPSTWTATFDAEPAALIAHAKQSDWWSAMFAGWAAAAIRFGDASWSRALLTVEFAPSLLGALPIEERAEAVAAAISGRRISRHMSEILDQCPTPWPESLGRATLALLGGYRASWPGWWRGELSERAATGLPVALLAEAEEALRKADGAGHRHHLAELVAVLRQRADITRELTEETP